MMDRKIDVNSFNDPTIAALSLGLIYFIYFIALTAVGLMVGVRFSAKFSSVSVWVAASLLIAGAAIWPHVKELLGDRRRQKIDGWFVVSALVVFGAGGLLSASINRPDIDDSIYAPKAVSYLEHPSQRLNEAITWISGLPANSTSIYFQYYETVQASLAHIFVLHFLDLYHVVFPAIAGFLMCLSMLLVMSIFDQRRWAVLFGVVLLVLVTMSLGETHHDFGNVSIARLFQGKFMFLAVGMPAWIYFSLRYLALKQLTSWIVLLAIGIGMVSATTTAMVLLPLLSGLIYASYIINEGKLFRRDSIVLAVGYFTTLVPVVIAALQFRSAALDIMSAGTTINKGWPSDFEGQLYLLIDDQYPLTPILFLAALVALLLFSRYRLFFASWILLAFVLFLNPLVSTFVIKNITTENIYWRLFYLIPFPIMVVISFLAMFGDKLKSKMLAGILLVGVFYFAFWGPTSVIRSENGANLGWPGYKIHEPTLSVVKEIAATVPEGSMFAPIAISSNMLVYSSRYPQFHMREDYLQYVMLNSGMESTFVERSKIYKYLYESDSAGEGKQAFEKMLSSDLRPYVIVVPEDRPTGEEIDRILTASNYRKSSLNAGRYVLFIENAVGKSARSSL
jgi:hypothetical protein